MILEAALTNYPRWRTTEPLVGPPEIIEQLNWGTAHNAVRVRGLTETGSLDFVIRFLPRIEATLALDFSQEVALMSQAATEGLAPEVIFVQPQNRLLITEFIDGSDTVTAKALGKLMAEIHALPAESARLDLHERINAYTDAALARSVAAEQLIDPQFPPLAHAIEQLEQQPQVICHNDLGPGNVFESNGKAIAIDWEYAAKGSAYFDLAAACTSWPDLDEGELVSAAIPRNFSPRLWQQAKAVYAAIEWNWYQACGAKKPQWVQRDRVAELMLAL